MKLIVSSLNKIPAAIRAAYIALFFAASAGMACAGPNVTPPFVQTGSIVTTPGASGTYNNSYFQKGGNTFTVTVSAASGQTATLNNTDTVVLVGNGSTVTVDAGITINNPTSGNGTIQINGNGTGTVINYGTITGDSRAIVVNGVGTVFNYGTLSSPVNGIVLTLGGSVTNSSSGTISGNNQAVLLAGSGSVTNSGIMTSITNIAVQIQGTGSVTNSGSINSTDSQAIYINGTGTVINSGTSTSQSGIFENGAGSSLTNSGSIIATAGFGVDLNAGGTVINSGSISANGGGNYGIYLGNGGTITNSGSINSANSQSVYVNGDGVITNSGTMVSPSGIDITGAGSITNSGTILATGGNAISYGNGGTVINSGFINAPNNTDESIFISGKGYITNSGSMTSSFGVYVDGTGSLSNSGIIVATSGEAVHFTKRATVTNSGTLLAANNQALEIDGDGYVTNSGNMTSELGVLVNGNGSLSNTGTIVATNGIGLDFDGGSSAAVANSGSIVGTTVGVNLNGNHSSLVTDGGVISGGTGDSVILGGHDSSVTIVGRTDMVGLIQGGNHKGNVLSLDLIGVTPAQAAALKALSGQGSGDITLGGGYTYNWTGFASSSITAVSLEQVVDPGLVGAATAIDNNQLPLAYDSFYLNALANPEAALNELVGREINQGIDTLGVNLNTTLTSDLGQHFDNILTGNQIGGFDVGGLHISDAGSMYAMSDTSSQLESILHMSGDSVFGGTEMSTDAKAMVSATPPPSWGIWASGNVTLADESATSTLSGYHSTLGSPTFGFDYRVTPNIVLGVLANYTTGGANFDDGSKIGLNTEIGALYGVWHDGNWHVNGVAGAGTSQYNDTRTTFGGTATSTPRGDDIVTDLTAGYDFHLGDRWNITPEAGLQYTHLDIDSFTESGAGIFDLSEGSQNIDSLRSHVGFKLDKAYSLGQDVTFIPELRALWYHEFMDNSRGISTSLPGAPALGSFSVNTFSPQRDFALVGVGLNTAFTGYKGVPVGLFVNYDAQVGQSDYIANSVNAGIRVDF